MYDLTDAIAHAREAFPQESMGAIINGSYHPLINASPEPGKSVLLEDHVMLELVQNPGFQGLVHSHPEGQPHPSVVDQKHQLSGNVPWAIIVLNKQGDYIEHFWFGDQAPRAELYGRTFRHYVADCYAACRDWYHTNSPVRLPNFPRDYKWWAIGHNVIEEALLTLPHTLVNLGSPRNGDMVCMKVMGPVTNHLGIYHDDLLFHHMSSRVSKDDPVNRYHNHIVKIVRFTEELHVHNG